MNLKKMTLFVLVFMVAIGFAFANNPIIPRDGIFLATDSSGNYIPGQVSYSIRSTDQPNVKIISELHPNGTVRRTGTATFRIPSMASHTIIDINGFGPNHTYSFRVDSPTSIRNTMDGITFTLR